MNSPATALPISMKMSIENPDNVDTGSKVISEGQGATDADGNSA